MFVSFSSQSVTSMEWIEPPTVSEFAKAHSASRKAIQAFSASMSRLVLRGSSARLGDDLLVGAVEHRVGLVARGAGARVEPPLRLIRAWRSRDGPRIEHRQQHDRRRLSHFSTPVSPHGPALYIPARPYRSFPRRDGRDPRR